jgi:hypothetical protein
MKGTPEIKKRRAGNHRWKHIYGVDRGYTARCDRLLKRTTPESHPSHT